jgi:hypothetical protein
MNNKLLSCLVAGALATTLALASPALARGGGGGGGGHGYGGGGHYGGMHVGGMGGGMHFSGARFAGAHFAHAGFSPRFHGRDHFHHRFHRFGFFGAPYAYASYDGCWRRVWTPYGLQWANVCGDYGY